MAETPVHRRNLATLIDVLERAAADSERLRQELADLRRRFGQAES